MFLIVLVSGIVLHIVEKSLGNAEPDSPYYTMIGTMWEVAVFLFSGYDAEPPKTTIGRVLSFVCLFSGIALVLMLTADLSSQLVATALAGRGRKRIKAKDHILICGWHYTAQALVQQLISRERNPRREIVVVDVDTVELQVYDPDVHLVRGDPTDLEVLQLANAPKATHGHHSDRLETVRRRAGLADDAGRHGGAGAQQGHLHVRRSAAPAQPATHRANPR